MLLVEIYRTPSLGHQDLWLDTGVSGALLSVAQAVSEQHGVVVAGALVTIEVASSIVRRLGAVFVAMVVVVVMVVKIVCGLWYGSKSLL
jgi:hypothetical protein